MQYNSLDKAGFKVSRVSFGCMSLKNTATNNDALISKAIDEGITLFDTADLYDKGENEKLLGKALKGNRQKIHISTKVGNQWRKDGSGWDWNPRKEYILKAVDDSLKRLQTDYIDLYLLHGGTIEDPIDETIEAFERLTEQGKIVSYGISSIRPNVIKKYVKKSNIAAVMLQYSLLDRRPEEEILKLLKDNTIGVLARGTVAGGLLGGKPAKEYLGIPEIEVATIANHLIKLTPEKATAAQTAMRYVMSNQAITTAVAGIRTEQQLYEALQAGQSGTLPAGEYNSLRNLREGNTYQQHL
ncbi:aldo/keto reductase [Flavobacterium rhizosphaerae]|uniref:Aldo/keto reductase n=1 Tax=Flavobacterium rhizosphaerae TaxID=3163298 RepID=A0ABW8YTE7_9FLAO